MTAWSWIWSGSGNPRSLRNRWSKILRLLKAYGISTVEGDRYSGQFAQELFRKCGISYRIAERPKSELYLDLLPLLNSGKVELLDNPRLINQLCRLERRTSRGGKDSIDHAPGAHDDVCNSVAGCLWMAAQRQRKKLWFFSGDSAFGMEQQPPQRPRRARSI